MANAAFKTSKIKTSLAQNRFTVTGTLSLANVSNVGYVAGNGIPVSFAGLVPSQKAPDFGFVTSANVTGVSAYSYVFHNDSNGNVANCSVQVFTNGNLATELSTTVPAAVYNDNIRFNILIPR